MSLRERIRGYRRAAVPRLVEERGGHLLELADFPGMAQVCLMHATAGNDPRDVWEEAPHRDCICKRAEDAESELRTALRLAEADLDACLREVQRIRGEIATIRTQR
jgi:hypothetical protein